MTGELVKFPQEKAQETEVLGELPNGGVVKEDVAEEIKESAEARSLLSPRL